MRKIISLTLIFIFLLVPITTHAADITETIRVGLFFGSSAKAEYTLSTEGGVSVTGGGGTYITEDSSISLVTAKKDDSYHAAIDGNFESVDDAWTAVNTLKENGINAFYMLDGSSFSVYADFCETQEEAQIIADKISAVGYGVKTVSPNSLSVILYSGSTPWTGSVSSGIRVIPASGSGTLGGKEYRGLFEFYRDAKSDMAAVNVLSLDEYLMGVVPKEVSPSWNIEALKAQAIVARTYAVTNLNKFESYGFNVDDSTQSQVYGGKSAEHESTNQAVLETKGQFVMYDGKPAEVFFFSSSGGMTENVENVWGGAAKPYLVSVPDTYENPAEASHSSWSVTLSPEEVKAKLAGSGVDIGDILDITMDEVSVSGRSLKTTIHGTSGTKTYTFSQIRTALGLYSNCFTVTREGGENPTVSILSANGTVTKSPEGLSFISKNGTDTLSSTVTAIGSGGTKTYAKTSGTGDFILNGKGYGHGIGMSQWGAKGMADAGFTYEEIIKHYFKNTEVS